MNKQKLLLVLILLVGMVLRTFRLIDFPAGFSADEASHGYDAYSLLLTGKDQWGHSWPLAFESFGDFKLPVYTYLTIPFVYFLDLNELAVRLPGALLGTVAILMTYLFVKELFKDDLTQPSSPIRSRTGSARRGLFSSIALMAALLLSISPWHIQLSRGAFEANLTSFFIPAALWAWAKGLRVIPSKDPHGLVQVVAEGPPEISLRQLTDRNDNLRWWVLAAVLLGLNLYTYHAARAFTLLIIPVLIWFTWRTDTSPPRQSRRSPLDRGDIISFLRRTIIPALTFSIFLIPMVWSLVNGSAARGLDVAIFNPTDHWEAVREQQHFLRLQKVPGLIVRGIANPLTYSVRQFTSNYLAYFSPKFLFVQGPGEATYGMLPGRGLLLWPELLFLIMALIQIVRQSSKPAFFLLFCLLLAVVPAALTKGDGSAANRAATMLPFVHILSAYGAVIFLYKIPEVLRKIFGLMILIVLSGFLVWFLVDYRYRAPLWHGQYMSYGWREAVQAINKLPQDYEKIIISRQFTEPQIYPMFFTPLDPEKIQQAAGNNWMRYRGLPFLDQLPEYELGLYTFQNVHIEDLRLPRTLLLAKSSEIPAGVPTIRTIYHPAYPEQLPEILIIDPMAAGLLIQADNKVLLIKQIDENNRLTDQFGLPGGLTSESMTRLQSAQDKLRQTVGLVASDCQPLPQLYTYAVHRPAIIANAPVEIFRCLHAEGNLSLQVSGSVEWINMDKLPVTNLLPNILTIVKDAQGV